jgi:hypothetical protein
MNFLIRNPNKTFFLKKKRDIVLELFLLLRVAPFGLEPLLHENQDQHGFQDCIPECTVRHLIREPGFLLEQFVYVRGMSKRPDQVLLLKMTAGYLPGFRTICFIHIQAAFTSI